MADLIVSLGETSDLPSSREQFRFPPVGTAGAGSGDVRAWIPFTFDSHTSDWTSDAGVPAAPTSAFSLSLRMQCNTPLSACEFLIALDSLNCTSSGGVIDHPGIALPKDTTTTYAPENLVITGFDCLGNSWTAQVVVEVPDDAWDHTTPTDSRPVTSDRAIWSLVKSDVGAVIARADVANRRIIFRVPGYSGDIPVEPTSGSNEEFYFSRGSAIFLAVTHRMVNGLFEYACYASVGHTGVYHATVTSSTALHPDTMNFFDPDTSNPECMYVWGGTVDESNALQDSNIKSSWKLLSLLFQKTIYMNPTLPPD